MPKKVALIRGDGVGPELVDAMLNVVRAAGTRAEFVVCDAGSEWWEKHGGASYIPPETWQVLERADAAFKGPTTTIPRPDAPRSVAVSIRQRFDLFANIRPIRTLPNLRGPLGDVDFVCVREATEGLYSGIEYRLTPDVAIAIRKLTRRGCERIARKAFEIAGERQWKRVIAITKRNILRETDSIFMDAVRSVAQTHPHVELDEYFIDNMSQQLIKNPDRFNHNVLLSTNLFMDILSEEASGLIGSIGAVYSGNFGDNYAMFEPAHGSAPKYKGQDKVNPTATILSGAWLLRYIGERQEGDAIFQATEEVIAQGQHLTYDLGGSARLSEMARAIATRVQERLTSPHKPSTPTVSATA
jgi:isocitrate dehydrogenase